MAGLSPASRWNRSEANTNVDWWGGALSRIVGLQEPLRSGAGRLALSDAVDTADMGTAAGCTVAEGSCAGDGDGEPTSVALFCPVTSVVKDCINCDHRAETDPEMLLLLSSLLRSLCRTLKVSRPTAGAGKRFRYGFFLAYDPGDALHITESVLCAF